MVGSEVIEPERAPVLYVAPFIGFFGTLVWCIRFAASEPAKTRLALIVVFIASVIAFFGFTFPVFGRGT
jgi:asparagine N-glycosylation enzyme membrane subunit Stt3